MKICPIPRLRLDFFLFYFRNQVDFFRPVQINYRLFQRAVVTVHTVSIENNFVTRRL